MAETAAVTRQEAADMYRVEVRTISTAIHSGALRAKRPGRSYRIAVDDLKTWWDSLPDA